MSRPVVRAGIAGVASYLPERIVTSAEVEQRIADASAAHGFVPRAGIVEELTGVRERRYKRADEHTSDMAVAAARKAMANAGVTIDDIDLIVFGSSSQDLVEPATSHIVSAKLGGRAVCFDIKNACNSFVNGMQVADALIRTGQYRKALICTGECPSEAVRWNVRDRDHMKASFAGYTFGDAGAAMVLEARTDGTGIHEVEMVAASRYWELCTLPTGGSMNPRDLDKTYFEGDGSALRDAFIEVGPGAIVDLFKRTRTTFDDYDVVLFHQVSNQLLDVFQQVTGVPDEKVVRTVDVLGNVASATLPIQLERAMASGRAKPGDHVLWIGVGAGISTMVMTTRL
ncbi:MAG: Ketoacyl-ACP synthase [Thermoleophilia bacterium]|nr:Ketoacyl-ACP synthase [Thermoleophilia bacterium]